MTRGLERWQRVLLKLKEVSGFTTDLPRGEGMGVAVVEDHGSICGACATVSVSRSGQLSVEKVVLVMNSGYMINPRNGAEQIEGSVCWELSHALYGGLTLADGRFVNSNFDTYNLMRMHQMPEVEVHFALSQDGWWGGMGEPGGPADTAGGRQCDLLRHRKADSFDADQQTRPELDVIWGHTRARIRCFAPGAPSD